MSSQIATYVLDIFGTAEESDAAEVAGSLAPQNPNSQNQARQIAKAQNDSGARVLVRIVQSPDAGARVMLAFNKASFTSIVGGTIYPPDSWSMLIDDPPLELFLDAGQALFAIGTSSEMVVSVAQSKWCAGGAL